MKFSDFLYKFSHGKFDVVKIMYLFLVFNSYIL